MPSSTPVTVTVCAVFQLAGVKVSDAGATVPSVVSLLESAIVTLAVGWLVSTAVKLRDYAQAKRHIEASAGYFAARESNAQGLVSDLNVLSQQLAKFTQEAVDGNAEGHCSDEDQCRQRLDRRGIGNLCNLGSLESFSWFLPFWRR